MPHAGFSRRKAAASAIAATLHTATKKYAHGQTGPAHTVRSPARHLTQLCLTLPLECAGFQGDAPFSRGAPQSQFTGRGNWGAAGDAHGATQARRVTLKRCHAPCAQVCSRIARSQFPSSNAHWTAQGNNGGGWPGGGGAGAQGGALGGSSRGFCAGGHTLRAKPYCCA
jgi:hypothetical protein